MKMTAEIEDAYAEAFSGYYSEILVTAKNKKCLLSAVNSATGFATSIIGCSCEAGIDQIIEAEKTPDRRIGATLQFWIPSWNKDPVKALESELIKRIGQCILTAPTTRVFNATESKEKFPIGKKIGYFADGFQKDEKRYGKTMVIIPRMMGEFLVERDIGYEEGVMGGDLWFFCKSEDSVLMAADKAISAISKIKGAITIFPGGICASGSKIGSRYEFLIASTNERFCPTLRCELSNSLVPENVNSIAEIVINGISEKIVREAMHSGIKAAREIKGLVKISAGNYGGKLGKYKIYLKK